MLPWQDPKSLRSHNEKKTISKILQDSVSWVPGIQDSGSFWDLGTCLNMTYLGQHVTSHDLDLGSNVDLIVQSHYVYVSICPVEKEYDDTLNMPLDLLVRSEVFFCKNFEAKTVILTFSAV